MDYTSLTNQLKTYANRTDDYFNSALPYFIEIGQERIWREAKDLGFEKVTAEGALQKENAVVEKPADWNKNISFIIGSTGSSFDSSRTLYLRTYEFCRSYWPDASNINSENPPLFYADHQYKLDNDADPYSGWFIAPTPDQEYKYQVVYLKRTNLITVDNNTNLLTNRYPDLLFYACFIEALSFLQDNERMQLFEGLYGRALQSVNAQTRERYSDRTSKRDKD